MNYHKAVADKGDGAAPYILGGQVHLPGRTNDFGLHGSSQSFSVTFGREVKNDQAAIKHSAEIITQERANAKPGMVVGATLHKGRRIVKNFSEDEPLPA